MSAADGKSRLCLRDRPIAFVGGAMRARRSRAAVRPLGAEGDGRRSPRVPHLSRFRSSCGIVALLSLGLAGRAPASSVTLPSPAESERLGQHVAVLPNGNFVVVDPLHDAGAVRDVGLVALHRPDGSVISRLAGSEVGDRVGNEGVVVLANGHFVVQSKYWHGNRGAATWVDGVHGLPGSVTAENSLVGDAPYAGPDHVTALTNGNYVASSTGWPHDGALAAGAVTWCDGTTGCRGSVSGANSLTGTHANDAVGEIVPLPNGHFVVAAPRWHGGRGAVAWGDGFRGIVGVVSADNALVGDSTDDQLSVFGGVRATASSDYVVASPHWGAPDGRRGLGAVTWGAGTRGVSGTVSTANSLIGSRASDFVGIRTTMLADGSYLVRSEYWDSADAIDAGALTWCATGGGCTGEVHRNVSLTGATTGDLDAANVHALANGHAVLATPRWDSPDGASDVGAVTWIDGRVGLAARLDGSMSLVGSTPGDAVGSIVVTLPSGHFVAASYRWDGPGIVDAGAVTWRAGDAANPGRVSVANSFTGASASDEVGNFVLALDADDYVVFSANWDDPVASRFDVGAVTYCPGAARCSGTGGTASPTTRNSLTGTSPGDFLHATGVRTAGAEFLLASPDWDNGALLDAGAVTPWRGDLPIAPIGAANSLLGSYAEDVLGIYDSVAALPDGGFLMRSVYYGEDDRGALTYFRKDAPPPGKISIENSVIGRAPRAARSMQYAYDAARRQLVVGDPVGNRAVLLRPGELTTTELAVPDDTDIPVGQAVTIGVFVRSGTAIPTGQTRVYSTTGESCVGLARPVPEGAFAAYYECALTFAAGGDAVLRAEHFGDDHYGYSSSEPIAVTIAPSGLFGDGFETSAGLERADRG